MKSQIVFTALLVAAVATTEANENTASISSLRTATRSVLLQEDKQNANQQVHRRELRPVSIVANPTNDGAWGHCEGDCDVDNDCFHNLVCFHRQENQNTAVPGCRGGDEDSSATDYCVFPGDIPLSGNLFDQHIGDNLNDEPVDADELSEPTPQTTILSVEDPDGDTATDAPLSLVQASGVSSLLSHFIPMALVSVVSAAALAVQA
mmetsp:Transcript_36131/g.87335  ORF Transcript_36131/g.87335 Transcript_36131/m.87335 type:complete len:206 (+) Transcript_36131:2830-3447(+)|eukprot:CAMPEP_0113614644 /NCGR_PEP_ID=MMETSP0017_2-20120614/7279_1 /TAXON_ID=2856 /ORGANISM="Cylindrotheca closterium" /LENGTH=205 /DNA_ID=CAMNT_0000523831 /DNA_START=1197 /DNA_END=1814 /DNA_ORIENTATION=- /assembly_acc=CAM_ASM_000147